MNLAPDRSHAVDAPFLTRADHAEPSVFVPQNLLREARRQRGLPNGSVPPVCLLDPDGDVVGHLDRTRLAVLSASCWWSASPRRARWPRTYRRPASS